MSQDHPAKLDSYRGGIVTREKWMILFIVGLLLFALEYSQNGWTF